MKRRTIIALLFLCPWWGSTASVRHPGVAAAADTVSPAEWSLLIEALVPGAHDSLASLGVRPDATPDYDPLYEIPRPPPPPGTSVQVYFPHDGGNWPTLLGNKFAVDCTDPRTPAWRMTIETNAGGVSVTLRWDTAAIATLPSSYLLTMRDSASDSLVNLRATDTYTFAYDNPRTFLIEAEFASSFVGNDAGWNIVSLPRRSADRSVATIYPDRISTVYRFEDAYVAADSLEEGVGYWVKFPAEELRSVSGPGIDSLDIPLAVGWNIVGTLSLAIPAPIGPDLATPFYEYAGGYRRADSLVPGRGYWIKASSAGVLPLRRTEPPAAPHGAFVPQAASGRMIVRGERGQTAILALLPAGEAIAPGQWALPPPPPPEAFDARFDDGSSCGVLPGPDGELRLIVQGTGNRVTISAEGIAGMGELQVCTGPGRWEAITGTSEPVALSPGPGRTIIRVRPAPAVGSPRAFRLEGNYPNPFNPSTTIAFTLPEPSIVRLTVADNTGRTAYRGDPVLTPAGPSTLGFDPGSLGLATGTYFYTIDAAGVSSGTQYRTPGKCTYVK